MDNCHVEEGLTFRPTREQFKNFTQYLESCEREAGTHAVYKVSTNLRALILFKLKEQRANSVFINS